MSSEISAFLHKALLRVSLFQTGKAADKNIFPEKLRTGIRKDTCPLSLSRNLDRIIIEVFDRPFFKKVAESRGGASGRCPQAAKLPIA